jgi:hypothetical protein
MQDLPDLESFLYLVRKAVEVGCVPVPFLMTSGSEFLCDIVPLFKLFWALNNLILFQNLIALLFRTKNRKNDENLYQVPVLRGLTFLG